MRTLEELQKLRAENKPNYCPISKSILEEIEEAYIKGNQTHTIYGNERTYQEISYWVGENIPIVDSTFVYAVTGVLNHAIRIEFIKDKK